MSHRNQRLGISLARPGFAAFVWLGTALCCFVASPALSASAQRDRVFVASYGSDSNPCTFGSPCKTFQNAVNVVADGGEVTAIDSAGFGPLLITKNVTITSPVGVEAGITAAPGQSAIDIEADNVGGEVPNVTLRGLTLEGANVATYGVYIGWAHYVQIIDCTIRDFATDGIHMLTNFTTSILVTNSNILNNAHKGIYLGQNDGGTAIQLCYFDLENLTVEDNNDDGVFVDNGCGGSILNSVISNSSYGVAAQGASYFGSFTYLGQDTLSNNSTADVFQYNYSEVDMSGVIATLSTNSGTPLNGIITATDFTNHISIINIPISTFSRH